MNFKFLYGMIWRVWAESAVKHQLTNQQLEVGSVHIQPCYKQTKSRNWNWKYV